MVVMHFWFCLQWEKHLVIRCHESILNLNYISRKLILCMNISKQRLETWNIIVKYLYKVFQFEWMTVKVTNILCFLLLIWWLFIFLLDISYWEEFEILSNTSKFVKRFKNNCRNVSCFIIQSGMFWIFATEISS